MSKKLKDKTPDKPKENVMRFEFPEGLINPIVFSTPESKENWTTDTIELHFSPDMSGGRITISTLIFQIHQALQKAIDAGLYNIHISRHEAATGEHGQYIVHVTGERPEDKEEIEERLKGDLDFYLFRKKQDEEALQMHTEEVTRLEKCLEELALKNKNR